MATHKITSNSGHVITIEGDYEEFRSYKDIQMQRFDIFAIVIDGRRFDVFADYGGEVAIDVRADHGYLKDYVESSEVEK